MKLKLDENGNVVLQDGKPVYVDTDGKEIAVDVPAMRSKITALNDESKTHRLKAKDASEKLALFGEMDAEAAKKALSTVANLDDKKLIDAGEAEKVKAAVTEAYEAKLTEAQKNLDGETAKVFNLMVGGAFKGSKFVSDKLIVPGDMVQAVFGKHFKVEDGKVTAYDSTGNRVLSREKPGESAGFDEALEYLVSDYPQKDAILKGGPSGSGGGGGGGKAPSNVKASSMSLDQKMDYIDTHGNEAFESLVQTEK